MKILCVCEGGNVRSGQLAFFLKNIGHDAIAVGVVWNSPETVAYLAEWADLITVAEERLVEKLPEEQRSKVTLDFVVGPDRWGVPVIKELFDGYNEAARRHGLVVTPRPGGVAVA